MLRRLLAGLFLLVPTLALAQTPYGGTAATIPGRIEAEKYDVGGEGVAYHDGETANQGGQFRTSEGVDIGTTTDINGGYYVGWSGAGEWMKYTVNVSQTAYYTFTARVAAQYQTGAIHLEVDGVNVTGTIPVSMTGAAQTWANVVRPNIQLTAGSHVLKLVSEGVGYNLNWFDFTNPHTPYGGTARAVPGRVEAEDFDVGGQVVAYSEVDAVTAGNVYRTGGPDVLACTDTGCGYTLGNTTTGEWAKYTINAGSASTFKLDTRVSGNGIFHVEIDDLDVSGQIQVTSGATWQTRTVDDVVIAPGYHVVKLVIDSGGVNINWFEVNSPQTPYGGTVRNIPGTIQAEDYDVGGEGVAYHDSDTSNVGGQYRSDGVDIYTCNDSNPCYAVKANALGEYVEYSVNATQAGIYSIIARVNSTSSGRSFHVELDGVNLGSVSFNGTGMWTYITTGGYISLGYHRVRLVPETTSIDFNSLSFSLSVAPTLPTVSIDAPLSYSTFQVGAGPALTLSPWAAGGGNITLVELYQGKQLLQSYSEGPYSFATSFPYPGTYNFRAKVYDDQGNVGWSAVTFVNAGNRAPEVTLTAPANGAFVSSGTSITLSATAVDFDGSISNVEFWDGATKLNTDISYPYSYTWSGAANGTHTITAIATDNNGGKTTSTAATITVGNQPPTATITAPTTGTVVNAPGSITINANATDPDGTISKVEFYNGATLLNTDTAAPFSYTWTGVAAGTYTLTAKAYDNLTATGTSTAVAVTVNAQPSVSMTAPTAGQLFAPGSSITLSANASDPDGSVSRVEFYNGATLLYTDTSSPYSYVWPNVAAGAYSLTARAYDNTIGVTTSSTVSIVVNASPAGPIATPTANQAFSIGAPVTITVNATDSDGTITKVEFYDGATLLNTDTVSPYSFTWACTPAGSHTLNAKTYDNSGNVTTTSVTITCNAPPTVTITAPATGQSFATGTSVTISANAGDADGSVTKVDFFDGATLIVSDPSAPYGASWTCSPAGTHSLTAKAYDNSGNITTSSAVSIVCNVPPTVSITAPTAGQSFASGTVVTVSANASDSDGSIANVEFYDGATLLGSDNSAPFSVSWTTSGSGLRSLTAKAYDNLGLSTVSSVVGVTVTAPNQPPQISLDAGVMQADGTLLITATATDADGSIVRVNFYDGGNYLGSDTSAPYTLVVDNPTADHAIFAVAYDDRGASAVSATYNPGKPGHVCTMAAYIYSPAPDMAFTPGSNLTFSSSAYRNYCINPDSRETPTKFEYFVDGQLAATLTSYPYTFTIPAAAEHKYSVYGVATFQFGDYVTQTQTLTLPVTTPPTVAIASPTNGQGGFNAPSTVPITITSSDNGSVANIQVFDNDHRIGVIDSPAAQATFNWTGTTAGAHVIKAVATDNIGASTTSGSVSFSINSPPTVVLTAPSDGAGYGQPATINLAASASDSDNGVTKVEFYADAALLSTVASAPYTYQWTTATPGASYNLSAKAYDGLTSTVSNIARVTVTNNRAPTVAIVTSVGGTYNAPASVTLKATASDTDGSISRVEFYDSSTMAAICSSVTPDAGTTTSYSCAWATSVPGTHFVGVRAFDNASPPAVGYSALGINVVVNGQTSVTITSPVDGAHVLQQSALPLKATAIDSEATVSRVDFYEVLAGGTTTLLCTASAPDAGTTAAFTCNWNNAATGAHALIAKATDSGGSLATTVQSTNITIDGAPAVTVEIPAAGSKYVTPATVLLKATTNFTGATKVEFYDGASPTPICTSTATDGSSATSYTCSWTSSAVGDHSITAKAFTGSNATPVSNAVLIQLRANTPPTITLDSPSETELLLPAAADGTSRGYSYYQNAFVAGVGQVMKLSATVSDPDLNVKAVTFYRVNAGTSYPIKTITASSGDQATFSADVVVDASMSSTRVQYIKAVVSDGASTSTSRKAPVAISASNAPVTPCGAATFTWPCSGTPHVIPTLTGAATKTIEAERYDAGGQGVGYFKSVQDFVDPAFDVTRQDEDVRIASCGSGINQPVPPSFAVNHAYATNNVVQPTVSNGHQYMVTSQNGTSASFEPSWPTDGTSVTSGSVVFSDQGVFDFCYVGNFRTGEMLAYTINVQTADKYWLSWKVYRPTGMVDLGLSATTVAVNTDVTFTVSANNGAQSTEVLVDGSSLASQAGETLTYTWRPTQVGRYRIVGVGNYPNTTSVWAPAQYVTVTSGQPYAAGAMSANAVGTGVGVDPIVDPPMADDQPRTVTVDFFGVSASGALGDPISTTATIAPHPDYASLPNGWEELDLGAVQLAAGNYVMRVRQSELPQPQGLLRSSLAFDWIKFAKYNGSGSVPFSLTSPGDATTWSAGNIPLTVELGVPATTVEYFSCSSGAGCLLPPQNYCTDSGCTTWTRFATSSAAPYNATWISATANSYKVFARAKVSINGTPTWVYSGVNTVTVNGSGTNKAPIVTITAPATGSSFAAGATLTLSATAVDNDGTIAGNALTFVEVVNGVDTALPAGCAAPTYQGNSAWSCSWSGAANGAHTIKAIATDNGGLSGSATIAVSLGAGSAVGLATPTPPTFDSIPSPDPDSDKVGATAATFRVDESGNATYSIPINVLPGVAGMQPQISLSYNSGSGDGLLGVGWNLGGASAITRCRASREAGDSSLEQPPLRFPGEQNEERDQYCLNGQRLLKIGSVTHGVAGAEYRTEIDSFSRIKIIDDPSATNIAGAEAFTVEGKDGSKITFGGTMGRMVGSNSDTPNNSRLMVNVGGAGLFQTTGPAPQNAVMSWAQSRVEDTLGNYIDYFYSYPTNASGYDGQQLLTEIHYTGNRTQGVAPQSVVKFEYADRIGSVSYASGALSLRSKLLSKISVYAGAQLVRYYVLDYNSVDAPTAVSNDSPTTLRKRLASVQECAPGGVCYPKTKFSWTDGAIGVENSSKNYVPDEVYSPGEPVYPPQANLLYDVVAMKYGDVNGDGRTDMIWVRGHSEPLLCVSLANASGFGFTTSCPPHASDADAVPLYIRAKELSPGGVEPMPADAQLAYHVFDFNGDGRDDVLIAIKGQGNWKIILSDGSSDRPYKIESAINTGVTTSGIGEASFVDIDGDGMPDLVNTHTYAAAGGGIIIKPPCATSCDPFVAPVETNSDAFTPREPDTTPVLYRLVKNGAKYRNNPTYGTDSTVQCPGGLTWCFPITDVYTTQADGNPIRMNFSGTLLGADASCIAYLWSGQLPTPSEGRPDPIDLNGDGRADLRIRVRADYMSGGTCHVAYDPTYYFLLENIGFLPGETGRWNFQLRAAQRIGDNAGQVKATRRDRDYRFQVVDINGDGLADLFYKKVLSSSLSKWYFRLNKGNVVAGAQQYTPETEVVGLPANNTEDVYDLEKSITLVDIDGDGRTDILFGIEDAGIRHWYMRRWNGTDFDNIVEVKNVISDAGQNSQRSTFVDLDGDGHPEQVLTDSDDGKPVIIRRGAKFERNDSVRPVTRFQPTDQIKSITNGLGAVTKVDYAPLTQSAVYMPGANTQVCGPNAPANCQKLDPACTGTSCGRLYGRGSPVFDLRTPMYVVQRAQSSANGANLASIFYRYRGARMQSGGRGFLGFEEVQSLAQITDVDWMESATVYNQSFPFLGQPRYSRTRPLTSGTAKSNGWLNSAGNAPACDLSNGVYVDGSGQSCFRYLAQTDRQWPGSATEKTDSIHYAEDLSYAVAMSNGSYTSPIAPPSSETAPTLTSQTPLFVMKASTTSYDREPGKTELSHGETTTFDSYDGNGNLLGSTTTRYAASGAALGAAVKTVKTTNQYGDDNARWLLGRLTKTTVDTWLTDPNDKKTRVSTFAYRMGNAGDGGSDGLLAAEMIMPGSSINGVSLIKANGYDAFGNKIKQVVCDGLSVNHSWQACLASTAADTKFRPQDADLYSVRRVASTTYDSVGRFVTASREVFDDGAGVTPTERASASIDARDVMGNPTQATGINGVQTRSGYNAMGRKYFESANTGVSATTTFRFCSGGSRDWGLDASAAAPVDCPSDLDAAYRVESAKKGAAKSYAFFDLLGREVGTYTPGFKANTFSRTKTVYDNFGHVLAKYQPCLVSGAQPTATCTDTQYYSDITYDVLGRPTYVYQPHALSDSNLTYTKSTYGTLTVKTELPKNKNLFIHTKTETRNAIGEIVMVAETGGATACYVYNQTGQLLKTIKNSAISDCSSAEGQAGAITTTMGYDALGRKTSMSDPDKGAWSYDYNAAGELVKQTNARGCTLSYYDARGRLERRDDFATPGCTGATQHHTVWEFDQAPLGGAPSRVFGAPNKESVTAVQVVVAPATGTTVSQVKDYTYDLFGRPVSTSTQLEGRTYVDYATFDEYGRPFQQLMTAPEFSGKTGVLFEYSDADSTLNPGFSKRVRDAEGQRNGSVYYEVQDMDAFGHVTQEQHAANAALVTTRGYEPKFGRLSTIKSGIGDNIQNWAYDWDPVGNLMSRSNTTTANGTKTETFDYDGLNRLTTSTGAVAASNNYDYKGNIDSRTEAGKSYTYLYGGAGTSVSSFCPAGSVAGPHAVRELTIAGVVSSYCYDVVGNQIAELTAAGVKTREIAYTVADQAAEIRATVSSTLQSTVRFVYGAGREKIKREDWRGSNTASGASESVTHYAAGAEIILKGFCSVSEYGDVSVRRAFGDLILTQRAQRSGCGTATTTVRRDYRLVDHLGSTDQLRGTDGQPSATDGNNTTGSSQGFSMWGQRRDTATWTPMSESNIYSFDNALSRKGFTGHEEVDLSGLVHMGGRVYDPKMGRFIQADPLVEDAYIPQTLNRYTYVQNNPLSYTDPNGYFSTQQAVFMVAAIAVTVVTGGTAAAAMGMNGGMFMGVAVTQSVGTAIATAAVGGFASGLIGSGGNFKAGLQGAFTAVAFLGAGQLATGLGMSEEGAGRALVHGVTGGILDKVQGGNFGHGFVSAGLGKLLSANINIKNDIGDVVVASLIGGALSKLSGGKFANGAMTAAIQWAFNEQFGRMAARYGSRGSDMPLDLHEYEGESYDPINGPLLSVYTDQTIGVTAVVDHQTGAVSLYDSRSAVTRNSEAGAGDGYDSQDSYPTQGPYHGNPRAYGPNDILRTDDIRGRWVHGGGSGLQDPLAPRQGWVPTFGCTRTQNEDIQDIVNQVRAVKRPFSGKVPYQRWPSYRGDLINVIPSGQSAS